MSFPPRIEDGAVLWGDAVLVNRLSPHISAVPEHPCGPGLFLRWTGLPPAHQAVLEVGCFGGLSQFTAAYRVEPYWMETCAGHRAWDLPYETQFVLGETSCGRFFLLVPLPDPTFHCALRGNDLDRIELSIDSGDPVVVSGEVAGLYVAAGDDPYQLVRGAAEQVCAFLKTGRLRRDKRLPVFADRFGWCTWDAFYRAVSLESFRDGLESFRQAGVPPKFVVLDDGWQDTEVTPFGPEVLRSFGANSKFPGGLAEAVGVAKGGYGVETFIVWHALQGYWDGVLPEAFPEIRARWMRGEFSPDARAGERFKAWFEAMRGVFDPASAAAFYLGYHRRLREAGVDGVKVDVQANAEAYAGGWGGGRIWAARTLREGLEASEQIHFDGTAINCMANSSELIYSSLASTLHRTSPDFYPDRPETVGRHIYTNAHVSLWFGEFIHPDWDMFHSAHPAGPFHAAARAISGGPVYVSDAPGKHDPALLKKLVLPDGSVLRARQVAVPARESLFVNPVHDGKLYKIFNTNLRSGVIGIFNCRHDPHDPAGPCIAGEFSPSDVEGLPGGRFAVYCHNSTELLELGRNDRRAVTLGPLSAEIVTVVPIESGFAPVGLPDMFNSAGAIDAKEFDIHGVCTVHLRWGGRFLAWSERRPSHVLLDGHPIHFSYDEQFHGLEVLVHGPGPRQLRFYW